MAAPNSPVSSVAMQDDVGAVGHNRAIAEAIRDAAERYAASHASSAAQHERAKAVMPGGNTRTSLHFDPFPLTVATSFGAHIVDLDGNRYLDALGDFTAGLYGHGGGPISEAIIAAVQSGFANGAPGTSEVRLAGLICSRFPSIERVRFCASGTEANLYALALARAVTGRPKLLSFSGAYHGGVLAFGGRGGVMNVPFDWTVCRYNDSAAAATAIEDLGEQLAAVIVEPMMSNGGCIPATREFLRTLRDRCTEVGALLIFDEIVTSRMGRSGAQGLYNVLPDLTTLGKYIGGGFALGAFGGRAAILDRMDPGRPDALPHAGTFNNNVFAMTAGAAGLADVFTPQRADDLFEQGSQLRDRLNEAARRLAPDVQFTGLGSAINFHFRPGPITCPEDLAGEPKDLFRLIHFDLLEGGVYCARRGQINLSLAMDDDDVDMIANAVEAALERRAPLVRDLC